jgi:hypothetical protein
VRLCGARCRVEGRAALGQTLKPHAAEARGVLERVLRAEPAHEGAIHLYIHLLEAGAEATQALPYAERLAALAPGASHLVHMPSHTVRRPLRPFWRPF